MSDTTFTNGVTLTDADWFNDLNRLHYTIFGDPASLAALKTTVFATPYAVGMTQVKRKTADESVTSSTAFQDDDHLTFAIAANEEWIGEIWVSLGSALATTGMKVSLSVPAAATVEGTWVATANDGTTGNGDTFVARITATDTSSAAWATGSFPNANQANNELLLKFWVLNGANAGNVTLRWAQNTSSGTALTFRKGSYMSATRVA